MTNKPIDPEYLSIELPAEANDYNEVVINEGEGEKERIFTLQEMLAIHKEGAHSANKFCGLPSELDNYLKQEAQKYFKTKFDINLNN